MRFKFAQALRAAPYKGVAFHVGLSVVMITGVAACVPYDQGHYGRQGHRYEQQNHQSWHYDQGRGDQRYDGNYYRNSNTYSNAPPGFYRAPGFSQ